MGNTQSQKQHEFLYPSASLAYKVGTKNEGIPYPAAGRAAIDKLVLTPEFKNYVLSHLDDEHLMISLLQNATTPANLLENIEYFDQATDLTKIDASRELIENWKSATAVGMEASIQRCLDATVSELHMGVDPKSAIFLQSFQRRLAVVRGFKQAILNERKAAEKNYVERSLRIAPMNTQELPQIHVLDALCETGLAYLPMFPVLLPVVKTREQRDALIDPVVRFFQGLNQVPELTLYSAWSPPVLPPLTSIALDETSVVTSSGEGEKAIDGSNHSCWTSTKTRAHWTVALKAPSTIHSLNISWGTPKSTVAGAAPKTVQVLFKYEGQETFTKKATFDVQTYRQSQGTWDHSYPCAGEKVVAIKLVLAGTVASNTTGQLRMYKFAAMEVDARAKYVDGLELTQRIMSRVMDFTQINFIEGLTISVLYTLLRISGSLEIALRLVRFLRERNDVIPAENVCAQALYRLLRTIHSDAAKLQVELTATDSGPIANAAFDRTEKSPDIQVDPDGTLISNPNGSGYGLVNCVMDSGVWEWEMTLVQESHGDETTCLGVSNRPMTNTSYDSSPDVWVVRCYNGERYHGGARGRDGGLLMHPNDNVRFTYDASAQTLAVAINDVDRGVIFESVPPGISPCVMFYSSGKSARLLSVKVTRGSGPVKVDSTLKAPVLEEVQAFPSPSTAILEAIAVSARLRTQYLNKEAAMSPVLEFPFSVQVSEHTLEESLDLLEECAKSVSARSDPETDTSFRSTVALLDILEANFLCLNKSKINPAVVGLEVGAMVHSHQLAQAASVLNGLLNTPHKEIRRAAARVFAAGFSMFLPNIAERAELTYRLLLDVLQAATEEDMPKMALLKMVLHRMSTCEEVLALQQLFTEKKKWRTHVCDLISKLIEAAASRTILQLPPDMTADPVELVVLDEEFQNTVDRFLQTLQEQLICSLLHPNDSSSDAPAKRTHATNCVIRLLSRYTHKLSVECVKILRTAKSAMDAGVSFSRVESLLQSSVLRRLLSSLLHGLALCAEDDRISHSILPDLAALLEDFGMAVNASKECSATMDLLNTTTKTDRKTPTTAGGSSGWKQIKAQFEESDGSFTISDNGQLYTASSSNNTCATVPLRVTGRRIAWEFLLENDSSNDECSIFGAARLPITSRCYSSSPDLWMRRAYNGYLYANGRTTGTTLGKIHPGDTVRMEYDPAAGTIRCGVNGAELEDAYTDVSGDVVPACGSYRSDVIIRLLKVEVYGGATAGDDNDEEERAPWTVRCVDSERVLYGMDRSVLRVAKHSKSATTEGEETGRGWYTARGDRGASAGVHSWSFEILERTKEPLAFGITVNGNPMLRAPLAGRAFTPEAAPETSEPSQTSAPATTEPEVSSTAAATSDATTSDVPAPVGLSEASEHGAAAESAPARIESLATCSKGHHLKSQVGSPAQYEGKPVYCDLCFKRGLEKQKVFYHCDDCQYDTCERCTKDLEKGMVDDDPFYSEQSVAALALYSDGSLWMNGQRKALQWTNALSSLSVSDIVTIQYDSFAETVSFLLNGMDIGIAFGPQSTGAAVPVVVSQILGRPHRLSDTHLTVYPAASISSDSQAVKFKASGFNGSNVLPLTLTMQKTTAAVVGRMISALIAGPAVDDQEAKLAPWLQSPLIIGGLDSAVVSKSLLRDSDSIIPRWRDVWKFAHDKQTCFPANDVDLEKVAPVEPIHTTKAAPVAPSFVCMSGTVQVRAFKAEAVRVKQMRMVSSDPFVRCVLLLNGVECDSASTNPHVKGGAFPVWGSEPPMQLTYQVKKQHQQQRPIVVLRVDICTKGMLKPVVVASTEVDVSELAQTGGNAPIVEDLVQPLMPQGLLMLQVTHTPNTDSGDHAVGDSTHDVDSVSTLETRVVKIEDPDLFIEDLTASDSASFAVLLPWLETIEPEPQFMRSALEKTGSYSFIATEQVFIACLFKHGGLIKEAQMVIECTLEHVGLPVPSADMASLWQRVRQLRRYLRSQKQQFRTRELDTAETNGEVEETKQEVELSDSKVPELSSISEGDLPTPAVLRRASFSTPSAPRSLAPALGSTSLLTANVVWRVLPNCVSRYNAQYFCTVQQVGLDPTEELIFVRFDIRCDMSMGALQAADASTIRIGERLLKAVGIDLDVYDPTTRIAGVLEYDCTGMDVTWGGEVGFTYGSSGYSQVQLAVPSEEDKAAAEAAKHDEGSGSIESFEQLLEHVSARAKLLLQLVPATLTSDGSKDRAKQLLLELMERYAEPHGGPKFIRWRSQDGEDRWRGMVEVLRVQSSLKREISTAGQSNEEIAESTTGAVTNVAATDSVRGLEDQDHEIEDFTPPQAAMQACSVFVMSTAKQTSPDKFIALILKRMRRATLRSFGLQALHTVLQNKSLASDHQSLQHLLILLKPALRGESEIGGLDQVRRVHYLNNLEGCTAESLADVQRSFLDVYSDLSTLLGTFLAGAFDHEEAVIQSCDTMEVPRIHATAAASLEMIRLLFSAWTIHFSSRDQRFLLQCGILTRLRELLSSNRYELLANKWTALAADSLPTLKTLIDREAVEQLAQLTAQSDIDPASVVSWKPWSSSYVRANLASGILSTRVVLFHLYSIPTALLSTDKLVELGLPKRFGVACRELGASDVSHIYERVVRTLNNTAEAKQEAQERERRQLEQEAQRKDLQRREHLTSFGVPLFSTEQKGPEVIIEGDGTVAGVASVASVASVFANVTYTLDSNGSSTGNYFEVTILKIGAKDVGVGLAVPDAFPVEREMPGWVDHSFGYHGDDGRKFGVHSTPEVWPTWAEGDIIGCGIDFANRTIFYTRNGEMLGVGFTDVADNCLSPVIGFHSSSQKVQINFGLTDFAYSGAVSIHPLIQQYRLAHPISPSSTSESKEELVQQDQKTEEESDSTDKLQTLELSFLERQRELSCKQMEEIMQLLRGVMSRQWHLQKVAVQLSRFLLAVSCWSGKAERNTEGSDDEPPTSPKLVSDRSVFGTPAFVTSEDVEQLQSQLAETVAHELLALGLYIAHSLGNPNRKDNCASYHGHTVPTKGKPTLKRCSDIVSSGYPKTLSPVFESEPTEHPVLEFMEVEPLAFELLISLNAALQASPNLAKDVATDAALSSLCLLFQSGSPRVQGVCCSLFRVILPSVAPEQLESLLDEAWRAMLAADESYSLLYKGRSRKMPDSFVRVLLMYIRQATIRHPDQIGKAQPSHQLGELSGGVGLGDTAMALADECVCLLQELLDSPLWSEVVACHLTDVLRVACTTLEAGQSNSDADQIAVAHATTAVCAVISGIWIVRPGSVVVNTDGARGTVVSMAPDGASLKVLFKSKSDAEVVDAATVMPCMAKMKVDLHKLSQPLLQQLLLLNRSLLVRLQLRENTSISVNQHLVRLTAASTSALHSLLDQQPEIVIDAAHDLDVVKDVILVSLLSTELDSFPALQDVQTMCTFVQCRLLERNSLSVGYLNGQVESSNAAALATTSAPSDPVPDHPLPTSDSTPVASSAPEGIILFDSPSVQRRLESANQLHAETGVSVAGCVCALQYFMDDLTAARNWLRDGVSTGSTSTSADVLPEESKSTEKTEFTDTNPLRAIHPQNSTTPEAGEQNAGDGFASRRIPYADYRAFRFGAESDVTNSIVGGVCVAEAGEEGPCTTPARSGLCVMGGMVMSEVVVSFYHKLLGVSFAENISTSAVKYSPTVFGKKPEDLCSFMNDLDRAAIILRTRSIAARLLTDGNLNVGSDITDLNSVVRLLKLIAASETKSKDRKSSTMVSTLQSLMTPKALLVDSQAELAQAPTELIDLLITDAMRSFSTLAELVQPLPESTESKDNETQFVVSTPHPFVAPHECSGLIEIPSTWNGAQVSFNKRTATPSQGAALSFYFDKASFDSDSPAKLMYGSPQDTANVNNQFTTFAVIGKQHLYYRFKARAGSDKPLISLTASVGRLKYEPSGVVCAITDPNTVPVGLGSEDTLFNLFDDDTATSSADSWTVVIPDCQPLTTGSWFFEVTIVSGNVSKADLAIGVADVEFNAAQVAETHDVGANSSGCVFTTSGQVRHAGTVLGEHEGGAWSLSDVIGCLFDADANTIQFGKNGTWGPKLTAEGMKSGVRPIITMVDNGAKINFGDSPFTHPPTGTEWKPVCDRPEPAHVSHESNWGFSFTVEPLKELNVRVIREFDLIWTAPRSAIATKDPIVTIWRPKTDGNYVSFGDIITNGTKPPRGALAVHKDQCVAPTRFEPVFKGALNVRRPIPPPGYVVLGDAASSVDADPPLTSVCCVPASTVEECNVVRRALLTSSSQGKSSLWINESGMGTFFGSPSVDRNSASVTKDSASTVTGVGQGYRLRSDVRNLISGDWSNETMISTFPSITWSCELLSFLLDHPASQRQSSTSEMFSVLVDYLRSTAAPDPIQIVPLLIRIIRLATVQVDESGAHASLPIKKIEGVCRAILQRAVSDTHAGSSSQLPSDLLLLVDLAVEAQNLLEESVVRPDTETQHGPGMLTTEEIQGLFGPANESALHRLRHVLAFLRSLDPVDGNFGCLPGSMLAKVWFDHLSMCQLEESNHPYTAERVDRTVQFAGAANMKVCLDRRSSLGAGAKLTIKYGDTTREFSGSEESTWAETIIVPGDEFSYTFEAESGGSSQESEWGYAFLVVAQGPVGSGEIERLNFDVNSAALPVRPTSWDALNIDTINSGAVLAEQELPLHVVGGTDILYSITPIDATKSASNAIFALQCTSTNGEAADVQFVEGQSGTLSVAAGPVQVRLFAWQPAGVEGSDSPSESLAYRCTFRIQYKHTNNTVTYESRLRQGLNQRRVTPISLAQLLASWTTAEDGSLLEHINGINSPVAQLLDEPDRIALSRAQLNYQASKLSRFTLLELYARAATLQHFNMLMEAVLPIVNIRSSDAKSLGARIRAHNRYVFLKLKEPMLERALNSSQGSGESCSIVLDNFKATSSVDRREKDPTTSQCTFVQAYNQLSMKDSGIYRVAFGADRVFSITFQGESGIDAGGVFREGVSRIVEDLFSSNFSLLILCPNGQHAVHMNTEKYIPNPSQTSPLALSMFEFMGRLMGMSLRTTLYLPFELPSIVWKQLVGEPIGLDDLMAIDATTCRFLEGIRRCESDGIMDQETFDAKYQDKLRFVYTGSDGVESELMPGGRDRIVTFACRFEYCALVEERRLHEFDKQVAAIARGMEEVVPMRVLQLFSWSQLETLVAGSPTVDIAMWKAHTDNRLSAKTYKLFWQVMESLTSAEHAGFIRFAWGRSRLPAVQRFTTHMVLTNAGSARLPVSHTCFFSVEVPEYSTEAEMRHGLLTAIHYGVGGVLNG